MSATPRTLALAVVSTVALLLAPTAAAAPAMSAPAATTALPAAKVATAKKVTFRLQTKAKTVMYTSAKGSKKRATIPADYTMKAKSATLKNSRYKVTYKGKTGWVKKSKVSRVSVKTKIGKLSWAGSAKKNIKRWCKGVPVTTKKETTNYAQVSSNGTARIVLSRTAFGKKLDPNHALAVATQYHECAHVLQYRVYNYDFRAAEKAMKKVYPKPLKHASSFEHMADCIADAMGAKREGKLTGSMTYIAGYGGDCSKKQMKAAKKILAGKRI
jgi:hypothetical protein